MRESVSWADKCNAASHPCGSVCTHDSLSVPANTLLQLSSAWWQINCLWELTCTFIRGSICYLPISNFLWFIHVTLIFLNSENTDGSHWLPNEGLLIMQECTSANKSTHLYPSYELRIVFFPSMHLGSAIGYVPSVFSHISVCITIHIQKHKLW